MGPASLWLAIVITIIASTASSIGKALQKDATRHLPTFSLEEKIVRQYLSDRTWIAGLAADLAGGVLQAIAFAFAPISLLQPITGIGLVGLAVYSHAFKRETLKRAEWIAVALAGVGALGLGASSSSASSTSSQSTMSDVGGAAESVGDGHGPSAARMLIVLMATGVAVGWIGKVRQRWHRRSHQRRNGLDRSSAALYGLQAGGCFGLSAACCRTGFLMAARRRWTWGPFGIAWSIFLSSQGFVLQTKGLKEGATVVVCTCVAVTSMVAGVLIGLLGLGEGMPGSWLASIVRLDSWLMILIGVGLLAAGPGGAMDLLGYCLQRLPASCWRALPVELAVRMKSWANARSGLPEVSAPEATGGANQVDEKGSQTRSL